MPRKSSTRAAQGSGTIRQRKDGVWEARFTVGRDPGTGKQIQRSVYGKTQAEVRKKLTAKLQEIDTGIVYAPNKATVGAWLDEWASTYLGNVKASTVEQYKHQIRYHLKPTIGAVKLQALTAPMIQKVYNAKVKEGLSPKSVRNLHGVLHSALKQAIKLDMIRINPCDAVVLPRVEQKPVNIMENDQVEAFMKVIQGHRYESLFLVDLFTGMRQGEIIGLTWDCVNFEKGTITIYRQLRREHIKGGQYIFTSLKNDKRRTITVAPFVMDTLKRVQLKQKEQRLQAGIAWNNEDDLVFTNAFGGHLTATSTYNAFKKVCKDMGLPETRFHDLRHTFTSLSMQNGDDVKTVQENLGHSTPGITLSIYAHVTERMRKASADRMETFIQSCKG